MPAQMPDIRKQLTAIAVEKFGHKGDVAELVNWFIESDILGEQRIIWYLVKSEYEKRSIAAVQPLDSKRGKRQKLNRLKIKTDLAHEYDLSLPTVNNIIYRYGKIKI